MHELSIATEIISIVEKEIARHNLSGVSSIKLRIGALAGVNPEALRFGFEAVSAGTVLDGATLDIDWVIVKGKCRTCGQEFSIDDFAFICRFCDSPDIEMLQGQELDIVHLVES